MKIGIGNMIGRYVIEVYDTTPAPAPELVSAEIKSDDNSNIYLTFSSEIDFNSMPDSSAFTMLINSMSVEPYVVSFQATPYPNVVVLYKASEDNFIGGEIITISYAKPELNPLKGVNSAEVESFSDYSVTNNLEP